MYYLGVDIGYSNLKVAGGANGLDVHIRRPAGAGPAGEISETIEGRRLSEGMRVDVNGEPWIAGVEPGHFTSVHREIHSNYTATTVFRALATAGIGFASSQKVSHLVTGLPVSLHKDKRRRTALKDLLRGRHQVQNGRTVVVNKVMVTVQPIGAFLAASHGGADVDILKEGRVAIVDAGYYSLDWALVDAGSLKSGTAGTSLSAMSQIIESTNGMIAEEYGEGPGIEPIEAALRNSRDSLLLYGQRLDLSPYLQRARARVANRALSQMRRAYREESPVDLFIITGGGANDYAEALVEAYPKNRTYIPKDPATANARGFWHLAQQLNAQQCAS